MSERGGPAAEVGNANGTVTGRPSANGTLRNTLARHTDMAAASCFGSLSVALPTWPGCSDSQRVPSLYSNRLSDVATTLVAAVVARACSAPLPRRSRTLIQRSGEEESRQHER